MADWWTNYILSRAPVYGIDPRAALAVASVEGLSGAVGDAGTSFGPFQLHVGGALPRGRGRAWAESQAGIDYALRQMGQVAGGLKGQAAVNAIVRRFERPADPTGEVKRAMAAYGGGPALPPSATLGQSVASMVGTTVQTKQAPPPPQKSVTQRVYDPQKLANSIFSAVAAGEQPDVASLVEQSYKDVTTQLPPLPTQKVMTPQMRTALNKMPPESRGAMVTALAKHGYLAEAFYDPLGSWDQGKFGGPIGGHSDHVHLSVTNPQAMLAAIRQAQSMGLHAGENPYLDPVDPVHVTGSFHYKDFPGMFTGKKLGEGLDVSGDPQAMAKFYRWATTALR